MARWRDQIHDSGDGSRTKVPQPFASRDLSTTLNGMRKNADIIRKLWPNYDLCSRKFGHYKELLFRSAVSIGYRIWGGFARFIALG